MKDGLKDCLRPALLSLTSVGVGLMIWSGLALAQSRLSLTQTYCTGSTPCVLTYHNDGNRDGVNAYESTLAASMINNTSHPVPRWMTMTDGLIYGQPLYIHQLLVGGSYYNVVYVATENNTVLALNATNGVTLASINLNNSSDLSAGSTEIAIPVFDLPNNTGGGPSPGRLRQPGARGRNYGHTGN